MASRKPVPGASVLGDQDLLVAFRKPVVCGVSSLGIDHTSLLGDTVEKIAWQKGGIFKVTWQERFMGAQGLSPNSQERMAGQNHSVPTQDQVLAICTVWLPTALPM